MIPIKVQCACGQKYAFDVEPVNGRMPQPVNCPVCGADGTAAANEIIARTLPPPRPAGLGIHRPPGISAPAAAHTPPPLAAAAAPAIPGKPDPTTNKRGAKTRIIAAAVAGALVLLLAAGGFAWWHITGNSRAAIAVTTPLPAGLPNTLAEVNAWYAEPPAGQNAATFLQQAFDAFKITDQDRNSPALPFLGKGTLPPLDVKLPDATRKAISRLMEQNQTALQYFKSSLKYPESRYPLDFTQGFDMKLPHLAKVKQAAQLGELIAIAGADQHDAGNACGGVVGAFTLGDSLKSEPLLISQLVRIACFSIGVNALEHVLNRMTLPPESLVQLNECLKGAEAFEAGSEPMTRAVVGHRSSGLFYLNKPAAEFEKLWQQNMANSGNDLPKDFNLKEQIASLPAQRAYYEESFNHLISLLQAPPPDSLSKRLKTADYFAARLSQARTNKFYLCAMLMLDNGNGMTGKEVKSLANLRLAKAAVALERFRGTHQNAYPDSLAELAPEFLPQIPKDPYDGQPLRYHKTKTGYQLYSVGPNLRDDGGQRGKQDDGDIVFEVVNAPPPAPEFTKAVSSEIPPEYRYKKQNVTLPPEILSFIKAKEQQAEAFARQQNQELDPALKNYFSLVKAGRVGESQELFQNMRSSTIQKSAWLIWQIVIDAVLAVDAVGNNDPEVVMATAREMTNSLPPGCIYFGGTDPGRGLPTMLCAAPGDPYFVLTQNGLCDLYYLEILRSEYGSRIQLPTTNEVIRCNDDYNADAQRRAKLNQLKPGENFSMVDGRPKVDGQVAVMELNARIAKMIFDKNPDRDFYYEESYPLDWLYPCLTPHGLLMKVNRQPLTEMPEEEIQNDENFWSKEMAGKIGGWLTQETPLSDVCTFDEKVFARNDRSDFKGDSKFIASDYTKAYSKWRASIAGIYAWRLSPQCPPEHRPKNDAQRKQLTDAADFAFRQAFALCPYSPEAIYRYVNFLLQFGRFDDAILIAKTGSDCSPKSGQFSIVEQSKSLIEQLEKYKEQSSARTASVDDISRMEKEFSSNPTNFTVGVNLAHAYLSLNQTNRAFALLDQIVANKDVAASTLGNIAGMFSQLQNLGKLETTLARMTEVTPRAPETWFDLAALKAHFGKKTEAIAALKKSLTLSAKRLQTNPSARDLAALAANDPRFDSLKNNPEFQSLLPQATSPAPPAAGTNDKPDPQQQLKDLKAQFDQGKIDQQTYEQKKSSILNSL